MAEPINQIPKSLQAVLMAGLAPESVSPTLARSVAQWCQVLPIQMVAKALRQVGTAKDVVEEFRQIALAMVQHTHPQPPVAKREPIRNAAHEITLATLPPAVRAAIAMQDAYEAMSEAEYQNELARRFQRQRQS